MRKLSLLYHALLIISNSIAVEAFVAPTDGIRRERFISSPTKLHAFDISKPVFDLYSFQQVRGDALTKYNTLNQSEPLRINLFLLSTFLLLTAPFIAPEVTDTAGPVTLQTIAPSWLGAAGTGFLFVNECQKRTRQLMRLEKELRALDLPLQLPNSLLADQPFNKKAAFSIRQVQSQGKQSGLGVRFLVAQTSDNQALEETIQELRVLGRRLTQAKTFVVIVPPAGGDEAVYNKLWNSRYAWLAKPSNLAQWQEYMNSLNPQQSEFCWFGLSASGRSFASGTTAPPSWLQILGKNLSPSDVLLPSETSATSEDTVEREILRLHSQFYQALTKGELDVMTKDTFRQDCSDPAVNQIVQDGGRLDTWEFCLQDEARPVGLTLGDIDVTVVDPESLAYSTCIEFVDNKVDQTLLAIQKWTKRDNQWKMQLHQTIPWAEVPAGGMLLCDHRGCVSLVRSSS